VHDQYFGQFLLNKELLNLEQLRDILNRERASRPHLGLLAIDASILNSSQVEQIHRLQQAFDKNFGEIAVDKGFLTLRQLEDLLVVQQGRRLNISQTIIDSGYLTLAELEAAWQEYKNTTSLKKGKTDALYGNLCGIVRAVLDFSSAGSEGDILYEYIALFLRIIPRFLGEEPIIALNHTRASGTLITQTMRGVVNISTGLVMNDDLLLKMARRYSGENLTRVDELALDSIAEFLNSTNGIFTVSMSEGGLELDLEPQCIQTAGVTPVEMAFRVPIETSCGIIDFYICLDETLV